MTTNLQAVRGTRDILPDDCDRFRYINSVAYEQAKRYGFGEIMTPMFEFTDVFQRTLGDTSDIVNKEMYTFTDRGGDSLTLRPEGTAGIARSFISEGMAQSIPVRLYYCGPMFRYERPQKGRYRQFHQIGVECLGINSPIADIECLALSRDILFALNLGEKVQLELNTLGDLASRQIYREKLVDYFSKFKNDLSKDSQERLEKNPLRILDSKDEKDQKLFSDAPALADCLTDEARQFFDRVELGLQQLGITYIKNPRLVRGLDYYCHTVFEWTTNLLGAQSAVLAGGRYDGLIQSMGGPITPGVGWASGLERLSLLLDENAIKSANASKVAVIVAEDVAEPKALQLSHQLRQNGYQVEMPISGNMGKKFKRADKLNCKWAIILGSNEINQKCLTIKNLSEGTQDTIPEDQLWQRFPVKIT
ncbi:MAG: histidyl-tRNA synthetase [Pseudomonadota bacterium]|jgi:histidyl-tRNA synthetase